MIKRKEYVYECENYKIINPSEDLMQEIYKKMTQEFMIGSEVDYDDIKFNHYLFKTLVLSDNIDFQFDKYSLSSFEYVLNNPTDELEEIAYHIGDLLSDIQLKFLRAYRLEAKRAMVQLLQAQVLQDVNILNDETKEIKKIKSDYEHKKRVGQTEELSVKKLNKFQIFLYNRGWIK